jgi:hypothetical protein
MMRKLTHYAANRIRQIAVSLWPGLGLLFLLPLLAGCPPYNETYRVYYDGNKNTEGYAPVDSQLYYPGDTAVVLGKSPGLKKGNLEFLGWRHSGLDITLQPGETIPISYDNVWLYAFWENDLDYSPYEYADDPATGGKIITRYTPYENTYYSAITIPNTLGGDPVTAIGEGVFADRYVERITLPGQLVSIGNKAFSGTAIQKIVIPDTVRSIGKLAFQNCYNLEEVTFGSGLETIGDYAFDGSRLMTLLLPETVKTLEEGAFAGNGLTVIEIGSTVTIKNDTSLGTHGASFRGYYAARDSRAGIYLYNANSGQWKGPLSDSE